MRTTIIELRQKRAKLIADARALLDRANGEKRDLVQEEQNNWDTMMNEADRLRTQIDREERLMVSESETSDTPVTADLRDGRGGEGGDRIEFRSRGMLGTDQADPDWRSDPQWQRLLRTASAPYRAAFRGFLRGRPISGELRALQADLDTAGGNLMAPIQMVDRIIQAIDNQVYIRQWATVFSVPNADSLGVPTLDADPDDADWTTELATGSEDSTMAFGSRELHPHPLAKRIKVSRKLIMKVPNVEDFTIARLGYKFGVAQEKGFLTGNGAGRPLGVFTASSAGISTGRDVSTDNTTTSVSFDGLTNAKYTLKQQYWARARWMGHRDFYKQVAKLKDGNGQYIWRESSRMGEPDMLLGLPTALSEYAPNTFLTGQYVAALADWSHYWISDSMAMDFQRLIELYAETNQVGIIGRLEADGQPTLEEAFVRVKLA